MDIFLRSLIGAIVWTFANLIYLDLRRKGVRRGRIIAFLVGWPGTFLSALTVREGQVARIEPPADDVDRLLREIRVDRELRGDVGAEPDGDAYEQVRGEEPGAPPGV